MALKLPLLLIPLCCLLACGAARQPVPPGEIPTPPPVTQVDEQAGHEILTQLTQQYPLDSDDNNINRVRDIVDRLAMTAAVDGQPWHVYVLKADKVRNAAATKGNHLFVWTGLLNSTNDDNELATVLAHEFGHLLAGHPTPSAAEVANAAVSDLAGSITKEILIRQGNGIGGFAGLAGLLTSHAFKALLVNPESQRKELEADLIGLFLMAEAGYDPSNAVIFWERIKGEPYFSSSESLSFLSSHPSSTERIENLQKYLPDAIARYRGETRRASKDSSIVSDTDTTGLESWELVARSTTVYSDPDKSSSINSTLSRGEIVKARPYHRGWLQVFEPVEGYIRGADFSPVGP